METIKNFILDYNFVYDLCVYKNMYLDVGNIVNYICNITGN